MPFFQAAQQLDLRHGTFSDIAGSQYNNYGSGVMNNQTINRARADEMLKPIHDADADEEAPSFQEDASATRSITAPNQPLPIDQKVDPAVVPTHNPGAKA